MKAKKTPEQLLRPTGTCFDDSLDYFASLCRDQFGYALTPEMTKDWSYRLCHGLARNDSYLLYAHAWVEDLAANLCWDFRIVTCARRQILDERMAVQYKKTEFYRLLKIQEVTRYTMLDAYLLNQEFGNYGPWIDRYRKLCRIRPIKKRLA